ncbi:MAG: LytTR family transcriptional regulator DNA-binding domain-containing protein [Huintestinicola sp.]|uniref:LytTR family transcriptional regulator DNA-binding domain-containing protein n=1 Tax=Huintestinicola sp. TaxID=2981661 RepID=UPI003F0EADD5
MEEKTITFISDRQTYTIPVASILYVMMKKQDAYVHLSDGRVLKTRMTFAEFQNVLGDDFIRLNRGCLVSAMAIHSVKELVNLSNGESLEYTSDHRDEITRKFRQKRRAIVGGLADNNNPTDDNGYHEHYKCFDNIPIAFTDIEMVFDDDSQAVDWIFRYGNEALARLENCPLEKLIGNSFGSIFTNMDTKWLRSYERAVLYGETLELIDYSPEIDKYLRIICFPTFKGHCGCMLFDICDTKMAMENSAGDRAVLMYIQKMLK